MIFSYHSEQSMPAINVSQHLHNSPPAMLFLIVASVGIFLPGVLNESFILGAEISFELETSENDDGGEYSPSFPFRLSTHPCNKEYVSLLGAVDSENNFLHYRESVRAPPQRYLAHS
jgi:hypothetical protein